MGGRLAAVMEPASGPAAGEAEASLGPAERAPKNVERYYKVTENQSGSDKLFDKFFQIEAPCIFGDRSPCERGRVLSLLLLCVRKTGFVKWVVCRLWPAPYCKKRQLPTPKDICPPRAH